MIPSKIRGTQEIFDMDLFNQIIYDIKKILKTYSFKEIKLPIIESVDLFKKTLGDETDIITKEMFLVTSSFNDTKESEYICLRPEATAQIMRAYLTNFQHQSLPWKVFTYGSMFRYERPQKGRYREFNQMSIETIGTVSQAYDIECLSMLNFLFKKIYNIQEAVLEINFLGSLEDRNEFKLKLKEYIYSFNFIPEKINQLVTKNILRIFDLKDEECIQFLLQAPKITDFLSSKSIDRWYFIKNMLNILNVDYVEKTGLVRGLDYYNDLVFEYTSPLLGSQSAFCGGGRYNLLSKSLGYNLEVPSFGVGIGLDRLVLILEQKNIVIKDHQKKYAFIVDSEELFSDAILYTEMLKQQDINIQFYADKISFKAALKKANLEKINGVIIFGLQEKQGDFFTYKDLQSGYQERIALNQVVNFLKDKNKK